ncbi:Protein of unknown function (DUF3037) [Opitutaceae bacterium TAV1]|nr:Protein of unknown function (DUF3037) [Opitutaceae bacterium TAV1]
MNKQLACHYSVVRFCPYPETDEFVNVGVVLACPAIGYLDFKRASLRRRGRVGRFFPELDADIYSAAMHAWADSLKDYRNVPTDGQTLNDCDRQRQREVFKTIVRPRESILFYGEPRVILSGDPAATLDEVFGAYVERRFANAPEYQERVMCRRLQAVFREADLLQRYLLNEKVGNEDYQVRFPFVKRAKTDARPRQAIKALHLDRKNPTDILRHADDWRNVVRRLKDYDTAPDELLFVLQGPRGGEAPQVRAFDQVRRDLEQDGIPHVAADATPDILTFAAR